MKLYIDTASNNLIILELRQGKDIVARQEFLAPHRQAEKLLPKLEQMLKTSKKKLSDIKEILVATQGEGFTSLRIGVITANALAYALGSYLATKDKGRVTIARPDYNRPPSITLKK